MQLLKRRQPAVDEELDVYETFARDVIRRHEPERRAGTIARILVPVDFSICSMWALRRAETLARRLGGEIVLVHVDDSGEPGPEFAKAREVTARRELDALAALVRERSVPARAVLRSGEPAEEIIAAAALEHAELVVMGTHGRHGIERVLVGSVAERVVRRSPAPVLTVRAASPEALVPGLPLMPDAVREVLQRHAGIDRDRSALEHRGSAEPRA